MCFNFSLPLSVAKQEKFVMKTYFKDSFGGYFTKQYKVDTELLNDSLYNSAETSGPLCVTVHNS